MVMVSGAWHSQARQCGTQKGNQTNKQASKRTSKKQKQKRASKRKMRRTGATRPSAQQANGEAANRTAKTYSPWAVWPLRGRQPPRNTKKHPERPAVAKRQRCHARPPVGSGRSHQSLPLLPRPEPRSRPLPAGSHPSAQSGLSILRKTLPAHPVACPQPFLQSFQPFEPARPMTVSQLPHSRFFCLLPCPWHRPARAALCKEISFCQPESRSPC